MILRNNPDQVVLYFYKIKTKKDNCYGTKLLSHPGVEMPDFECECVSNMERKYVEGFTCYPTKNMTTLSLFGKQTKPR